MKRTGIKRDIEKYNYAAAMGWLLMGLTYLTPARLD